MILPGCKFNLEIPKGTIIESINNETGNYTTHPLFVKGARGHEMKINKYTNSLNFTNNYFKDARDPFTIIIPVRWWKKPPSSEHFFSTYNGTKGVIIREESGSQSFTLQIYNNGASSRIAANGGSFSYNKPNFFAFIYNGNLKVNGVNYYSNGILYKSPFAIADNLSNYDINSNAPLYLAGNPLLASFTGSYIGDIQIYNRVLSLDELNLIYSNWLNLKPNQKPIYNLNYPKPTIVNEEGLVMAYNMIPVNGFIPNIAAPNPANDYNPSNFNFTMNRTQSLNNNIYFQNKSIIRAAFNSKMNSPNITISFVTFISNNSVNGRIISRVNDLLGYSISYSNAQNRIFMISKSGNNQIGSPPSIRNKIIICTACFYDSGLKLYINGKLVNKNNTPFELPTTTSPYVLGCYSSNIEHLTGTIIDYRHYNRKLTENEIREYNNKFASQLVLYEDFSFYSIKSKTKHILNSGWVVNELSYNNDFLKKGSKYLTSFGGGRWFGISNKNRYGTFEFDILINTYSSSNMIYFISPSFKTTSLGYAIGFNISDSSKINIKKDTSNIMLSTNYSLQLNVFYHIKVEADINNTFKLYVNNIYLGTSTVDSTYLTTNIFKFTSASSSGMYISNIKIKQGIEI